MATVRELMHDPLFLGCKAEKASPADMAVALDLLETLKAHRDTCVGMAANMIGEKKAIIAFLDGDTYTLMFNPQILKKSGPYRTEEGCLSLLGAPRKTLRYQKIKVRYENEDFAPRMRTYEGFTAEIIQHEIDHCNGILI